MVEVERAVLGGRQDEPGCATIAASNRRFSVEEGREGQLVRGVAEFCRSAPIFSRTADVFDLDNYLLNCPDGTYDLRTRSAAITIIRT